MKPDAREARYSPHLRTALVLTGSGTAGAYHAGVLHALQEAGVKIDLVAGRGVGVVTAMFAAVDGGGQLWAATGLWRDPGTVRLYRWRATLRAAAWSMAAALGFLLLPLAILTVAVLVYLLGFLVPLLGIDASAALAAGYSRLLNLVFDPVALPTIVPRAVVLALVVLLGTLVAGAVAAAVQARARRRTRGALWWQILGTPLNASRAGECFTAALWQLIRGAAFIAQPSLKEVGQRYSELLSDNLGQPGFRELVVTAHDVDARRDLVFALLAEPQRPRFFPKRPSHIGGSRQLETLDLAGAARDHALDALTGALCLPVATEPHLITFAPESPWRGETHRLCDRPDALGRLLEEVANAGVEQIILVSATAQSAGPHTLSAGRRDARGRMGEHLTAIEAAAVRDALSARAPHFERVFQIRPAHNALGPFDFAGSYDERSDRQQTLAELVDRGYEDAYREFIDPVVGASGERLEEVQTDGSP